jgi:hypothetical protein
MSLFLTAPATLASEGRANEAWEPSTKGCSFSPYNEVSLTSPANPTFIHSSTILYLCPPTAPLAARPRPVDICRSTNFKLYTTIQITMSVRCPIYTDESWNTLSRLISAAD